MRVIGIDASTNKTGVCLFDDGKYIEHILIDCHKTKDVYERIPKMTNEICEYIASVMPVDKIVMEESILRSNIDTVKKLSFLMGGIILYAYQNNIEFCHTLPSEWRRKIGLQQSSKIKREVLKAEAIQAVRQEYLINATDDECESILIARSAFDLPKIVVDQNEVDYWGCD
jgi:Holliday junction resolvasome RuvABC endonuclease subunit